LLERRFFRVAQGAWAERATLSIADTYDRMANRAEARVVGKWKT
jgi:hypothetical protein